MKTNGEYADYGFLKQEMFQAWADYFVKFLDSYKNEGVEFWGITTGNEPHTAVPGMKINSVAWNASDMVLWSKQLFYVLLNCFRENGFWIIWDLRFGILIIQL